MPLTFPGSSMLTGMLSSLGLDLSAGFDSTTRLYRLKGADDDEASPLTDLIVEAWSLKEALDLPFTLELSALSLNAQIDIQAFLGQTVTLQLALADGSLQSRSGLVFAASAEESDGGFARYRLTLRPWTALLAHTRQSRVWQEKTVVEILESVFQRYAEHAQWQWTDDVLAHLDQSPYAGSDKKRSYTVQYRETDLDFVTRMLAEEGLGSRIEEDRDEEDDDADDEDDENESSDSSGDSQASPADAPPPLPPSPCHHRLVIFARSPTRQSCPEDETSEAGGGIRFHRESAVEESDAIQALGSVRTLQAATSTTLAWDYGAKRSVAASVPTHHTIGGPNAPHLESYRPARAYAYATSAQAQRAATLMQEAIEVRNKRWLGRSTVRTLEAGHTFSLTESPLDDFTERLPSLSLGTSSSSSSSSSSSPSASSEAQTRFLVTAVIHAGINNLPKDLSAAISAKFDSGGVDLLAAWVDPEVRTQAAKTGYGNHFEATRAYIPWRPAPVERPKAPGPLTAEVVGSGEGATQEIHTDRLGRIRIRHDFQAPGESSTWVRVLQPLAGSGHGLQFTPRIGQQVLVDFFDDDIERPFVRGALYTGRGEGGVPATPAGAAAAADLTPFGHSADHQPSGQGNAAGGNAPAWHAAAGADLSAGGQRNAGALSGWKTKEFAGSGFNQLVFDDSNGQLRTQLATTQYATQLNMGHLIHQADNHRGSFRGLGFELRTDAYGTLRGSRGILLSSYAINQTDPSGDNSAGIALAAQLKALTQSFNAAAKTHETVPFAGNLGSGKANTSALSETEASIPALHTALKGMVAGQNLAQATTDAGKKKTTTGEGQVPQLTDPVVAISAKAGLAITAGEDVAMLAGGNLVMGAGQTLSTATTGAARIHSGQAIGILGGAMAPGTEAAGSGVTLIAGKGDIEIQAQAGTLQVAAKDDVLIQSKQSHVDWAAAKKITLVTKAGASLVIEGGNITVLCPGQISVKAGAKSFEGPERVSYELPVMPRSELASDELNFGLVMRDMPGKHGMPLASRNWKAVILTSPPTNSTDATLHAISEENWGKVLAEGITDKSGNCLLTKDEKKQLWEAVSQHPEKVWLVAGPNATPIGFTSFTADVGEREQRQTLDALNYAAHPDPLGDSTNRRVLRTWVERDYETPLAGIPKSETKA